MGLITKQNISVECNTVGLNSLVASVVNLICQNTGLSVIDKIEHGSEQFEGFPIYNTLTSNMKNTHIFNNNAHLSDVYILGLNNQNFCLVVNIYNGYLLLSMGHSLDYAERFGAMALEKYSICDKHCPLTLITRTLQGVYGVENYGKYSFVVPLKKNTDNIVNMVIAYYKGDNSQGFKFLVDGTESSWLLFTKDDNNNKYAVLNLEMMKIFSNFQVYGSSTATTNEYNESPLVIPFNEEIPLYKEMIFANYNNAYCVIVNDNNKLENNAYYIKDVWINWNTTNSSDYFTFFYVMARTHSLHYRYEFYNSSYGGDSEFNFLLNSLGNYVTHCPTNHILNLPKLAEGQVYLRKLYVPDDNKKFNFYLWYSPVVTTPAVNSFYEVGSDIYLLSTNKCIGYALKV
jgi:hypothetical protein